MPSRAPIAFAALVLAALGTGESAGQVRTLLPITSSSEEHLAAVLSPSGDHVAFRGPDKLGVVAYTGGSEVAVATGRNLGTFVWSPDGAGLYYMDGRDLRYVPRGGGSGRLVATLPETSHALWTTKRDGTDLFGTWLYVRDNGGQPVRETQIFAIATDGNGTPRVLVRSIVVVDGVRLSPDETRMVYREYDATPFSPRDYIVAAIDGSNPVSLTGGTGLGINPDLPSWLDNSSICFARVNRALSRAVVERLTLASTTPYQFTFPTAARNVSVSADRSWIVYEGFWPHGSTWTPVVVPASGGGHVFLDTARALVFSGTPMLGGATGDRFVVSGTLGTADYSQVLKAELARELLVRPRADLGGTVDVELPVHAGEIGIALLAAAPLPAPFPVPGFAGSFQLDPTSLVTLFSGTGSGQGPLRTQLTVPNVPFLHHRAVYLQGVRLISLAPAGDFTRFVELPIF